MRFWIFLAGLMGAQAVISGAISAHADLSDYGHELVDKAVQYEFWHALALLGVGILYERAPSKILFISATFFTVGTVLFCGTLYMLGFWETSLFAMSAPLGGSSLILGWIFLAIYGLKRGPQPAE